MAFKLKNLFMKKVDFVKEGANPGAKIKIVKSADFDEQLREEDRKRRLSLICSEIYDVAFALYASCAEILNDKSIENKEEVMMKNLGQFNSSVTDFIKDWSEMRLSVKTDDTAIIPAVQREVLEIAKSKLNHSIVLNQNDDDNIFEEVDEMKINKSLLTDDEQSKLAELIAKAAVSEKDSEDGKAGPKKKTDSDHTGNEDDDSKIIEVVEGKESEGAKKAEKQSALTDEERAEFEELKKFRQAHEMDKYTNIARKYETLGHKPEKLAKSLKAMHDTSEDTFNEMISALDTSLAAIEKSKLFSEIGKSGRNDSGSSAVAKARSLAVEIRKSNAGMSEAQAMAQVWNENPDLMAEYDEEIGG